MGGLFICILFSLLATGFSLSCVLCTNNSVPACTGQVKNCSEDRQCISTLIQTTTFGGQRSFTFERGCGKVDLCNISGSMSSMITTDIISACCNMDACTPTMPNLAPVKKSLNNVQCPVCLSHNKDDCSPTEIKNCTGDERYCALYEVKRDSDNTVIRGCASASFCHTAQGQKIEDGLVTSVSAKCARSGSRPVIHDSLALLLVLLLGKTISLCTAI